MTTTNATNAAAAETPRQAQATTVSDGLSAERVEDALRLSYDAFERKFRIGFRNADDLVRLFADSADGTSCLSAESAESGGGGALLGVLAFQTEGREFYRMSAMAAFGRFSPIRAVRVLLNLALLYTPRPAPDEFIVDSLAVAGSARGLGIGTALMGAAETKARSMGKRFMSLGVIGENAGAIRLYERLGYKITQTQRGFIVRLIVGCDEVHRMEKPLEAENDGGESP